MKFQLELETSAKTQKKRNQNSVKRRSKPHSYKNVHKGFENLKKMVDESDLLKQLLALMDLMPEISFYVKDMEGNYVALNRTAWQYCDVKTAEEAYGKGDKDFFAPERVALYQADEQEVIQLGKPILRRIEPAPEMEGSPQLVETIKLPIRNFEGEVVGLIGAHRRMKRQHHFPTSMGKFGDVLDYMHDNAADKLCTKDLAQRAALSESKFTRLFRSKLGVSPLQYIKRVRIENASRLLVETNDTVTSIAQDCGFYEHAHFTRTFKAAMSVSPARYRQEAKGKA